MEISIDHTYGIKPEPPKPSLRQRIANLVLRIVLWLMAAVVASLAVAIVGLAYGPRIHKVILNFMLDLGI